MTEYLVKVHFWLPCTDTLTIEVAGDAEAIEIAKLQAATAMDVRGKPDFIDFDERREGTISYIDRMTSDGREEVSDLLTFDEDRLYPDWHEFIEKIAASPFPDESEDAKAEALRQYNALIEEAKTLRDQIA
jgi:hypothetical protein